MLDTRYLTFMTVAETKSYTKAAEKLNLTQPAVSQHIKFLEDSQKVKLIERTGHSIHLTEEGLILLKYIEKIYALEKNLNSELNNASSIIKNYSVGATRTIGGYVFPEILGRFKDSNPNINIILTVSNTEKIIEKVIDNSVELALVEGPFDKEKFKYELFMKDELVLTVSPNHPFASKSEVEFEEIAGSNLILREKGSGTRQIIEDRFATEGYGKKIITPYMEIGSISAIKALVESNLGCTIISKACIKKELKLGTLITVPIKGMQIIRDFNFVYSHSSHNPFIRTLMDFCA